MRWYQSINWWVWLAQSLCLMGGIIMVHRYAWHWQGVWVAYMGGRLEEYVKRSS